MSDEQATRKMWMGVVAFAVIVGAGFFIYRHSQPSFGNVPQINMSREEISRGAMGEGTGAPTSAVANSNEPPTAIPNKGRR